ASFNQIERYVNDVLKLNEFSSNNKLISSLAPTGGAILQEYAGYVNTILDEFKRNQGKAIEFVVSQTALTLLNAAPFGGGKIYNPASIFVPPGLTGNATNTIDNPFAGGEVGTRFAREEDKILKLREGTFSKNEIVASIPPINFQRGYNNA